MSDGKKIESKCLVKLCFLPGDGRRTVLPARYLLICCL